MTVTDVPNQVEERPSSVLQRAMAVADRVAADHAEEVDATGRFPSEAIDALRDAGLLGALIPTSLGGGGADLVTVAEATAALGRRCSSTAMIFAMHQIQVASLARHGRSPVLREFLARVAQEQLLLASATTERGIGGDVRSSGCAVEAGADSFILRKDAPVISYGSYADAILVTARRTPTSPPNDQVLVLCRREHTVLTQTARWSAMGMRGTCSDGFLLEAGASRDHILDDSYGDISTRTMLPVSHAVWSAVWLGIATGAVDRARRFVQGQARSTPGSTPPSALRLAELVAALQQLNDIAGGAARRFVAAQDDPDVLDSMGFAISMNSVKTTSSTAVFDIVHRALLVVGIVGYREDTPYSLSRSLRDAAGAAVMVANDRIMANNAHLLLGFKGT